MNIRKFAYAEFPNNPQRRWELLELSLNPINLIVGKNAAGKSRTINVLDGLSQLLLNSAGLMFGTGHYTAQFVDENNAVYDLEILIDEGKILKEQLIIDGTPHIERNESNEGRSLNTAADKYLAFELPENQLACTRRDKAQYPYLESLIDWATTVRHFNFNTPLGKTSLYFVDKTASNLKPLNLKETEKVVETFHRTDQQYEVIFKKKIVDDFNRIGYAIDDIFVGELISLSFPNMLQSVPKGLLVKEIDRVGYTDQNEMSMGMFRALSIIIYFNAYELDNVPGCILIDDIGEGLDFEKSTNLINLLIEKSIESKVQLIMSSNDKFVMNSTDLKYWQIIKREGSKVKLFNFENSKEKFDEFVYTGLNNFDFFRSDFFEKGFSID